MLRTTYPYDRDREYRCGNIEPRSQLLVGCSHILRNIQWQSADL